MHVMVTLLSWYHCYTHGCTDPRMCTHMRTHAHAHMIQNPSSKAKYTIIVNILQNSEYYGRCLPI